MIQFVQGLEDLASTNPGALLLLGVILLILVVGVIGLSSITLWNWLKNHDKADSKKDDAVTALAKGITSQIATMNRMIAAFEQSHHDHQRDLEIESARVKVEAARVQMREKDLEVSRSANKNILVSTIALGNQLREVDDKIIKEIQPVKQELIEIREGLNNVVALMGKIAEQEGKNAETVETITTELRLISDKLDRLAREVADQPPASPVSLTQNIVGPTP